MAGSAMLGRARGPIASLLTCVLGACALGACSQTSRVGDAPDGPALAKSNKAVAVMRLGVAGNACENVGVWLGVREGRGYRLHTPVRVINVRSLNDPPVAEVELPPGEYHIVSYACGTARGARQMASLDKATGLVRTSYASFSVAAGEVVNVGKFNFHASRVGLNAFGRPYRVTVTVTDWPLDELELYKQRRPAIYAAMKTRLMNVTPRGRSDEDDDCDTLLALKAEGKVQNIPESCAAGTDTAPPAMTAAAGQPR
jgi:hypothetical protein